MSPANTTLKVRIPELRHIAEDIEITTMLLCASLQCVHACLLGRWQGLGLVQSRPVDGPPPVHKPTGRWGCPSCSCPIPGTCCTPPASHRPAEAAGLLSESKQVLHLGGRQRLGLAGSLWPLPAAKLQCLPCACTYHLHC